MKKFGIYIHIPFCESKCYYCDFNSFKANDELINSYMKSLYSEIKLYGNLNEYNNKKVDTIFIGGGTPSFIDSKFIVKLYEVLKSNFNLKYLDEFTIECNPNTVNEKKIDDYLSIGINRISLGLQSTKNKILKKIGRTHSYEEFLDNFNLIKSKGLDNISIDLIIGLPEQTLEDVKNDIKKIVSIEPKHISVYSLKLEKGTKLYNMDEKDLLILPSEEIEREMYHYIVEYLKENGYYQYEISNFAKVNYESKHNLLYWERDEYLGLGLSSSSLVNEKRFNNVSNIEVYKKNIEKGIISVENEEYINKEESLYEKIILGLRLNKGIDIVSINEEFGIDFKVKYFDKIETLKKKQLIIHENNKIYLTKLGIDISNQVFVEFIPE